jgi:CheY-like chemotaxis protein
MSSKPVILYVEDDELSRKVMRMITSDMGLSTVTIFSDSTDIIAKATALDPKPDLILLDIHMKPHNGFQMLKMLRESQHFEGVPIVAVTASVMNEEVAQLRMAGFDGCLAKPLDMDTFPDTVSAVLNGEIVWRIAS